MLLDIGAWWQTKELFEKIFWAIALVFSLLFVLQTIMSFSSGDADTSDGDADLSVDSDHGIGYQFFTIKNFIAFFTMFGWVGVAGVSSGLNKGLILFLALIAGCGMVALMIFILRAAGKMQESGTMDINRAVDKIGEVYLRIPGNRNGIGKIHLLIQGTLHELDAITDDQDDIPSGKVAKVSKIMNDHTLLVTSQF